MELCDEKYMRRCIELARAAAANGDVPVGAVVVRQSDGEIVGEGMNRRELDRSSLSHAELIAIDEASRRLGGWRLIDCALYVTLEPCAMCAGAIVNSRVERVVFGADDLRFGACGSCFDLFSQRLNHTPEVTRGVLRDECVGLLKDFFRELRERK
ncbi:MAG: tRNA adenosine(34) deaminase TadA [Ruminococcus sp.]|nr:tRNA adenosine(34) deaminase TadA [Ruminococcus sp.]